MAKAKKDTFENSNVIYEFLCPCEEFYIGQTGRTLETRADEHLKTPAQIFVPTNKIAKFTKMTQKNFLKKIKNTSLTH